ncbi:hypothetical protein [Qingshengfaniella alkalisoli]|uniref:Uncharacterized protein n=1 Tax=Qingshengfaniella alkalisoli TaxID=2599296 RepID=A0A5B8J2P7_9RHOB|nr:hypothetical protein [Qingshengfaniella alkalisoli]QDY68530.1 hypothetical protein FPZ52_02110 [Qingshengfaniella alkalisoli]
MAQIDIQKANQQLSELLHRKLGSSGNGLEKRLHRAGRDLPRRVRKAGRYLVKIEQMSGHPKLAMQVDEGRVKHSIQICRDFLDGIDPDDRRKGRVIGIVAEIAFNFIVLAGLIVAVLTVTGRIGPN